MHGGAEMEEWMELARPQSLWAEEIPSTSRSGGREVARALDGVHAMHERRT
jgi:hypothetical protein